MQSIADISYYRQGDFLGKSNSLTVIKNSPELNSQWVARSLVTPETVVVTFQEPFLKSKLKPKALIDLSSSLFSLRNGKFVGISLQGLAKEIESAAPARIVLDHPEILIYSGTTTGPELVDWINSISESCQVVISCCVQPNMANSTLGVCRQASRFLITLLHESSLILTISAFKTGRSVTSTGIFTVSGGPHASDDVVAQRYIYTVEATDVKLNLI